MKLNTLKDFTETRDAAAYLQAIETRVQGAQNFQVSAPAFSAPVYQNSTVAA